MPIDEALETCGITTEAGLNAFEHEGFTNVAQFGSLSTEEVTEMAKSMSARAINQNGYKIGALQVKRVKVLCFWARQKIMKQEVVNDNGFTPAVLARYLTIFETAPKEDQETKTPDKFDANKWEEWKVEFINYLKGLVGVTKTPLDYVVRDEAKDPEDFPLTDHRNQ